MSDLFSGFGAAMHDARDVRHPITPSSLTNGSTGSGPRPTDDLTPPARDALFRFQIQQEDPFALTAESLFVGKICETHQYAKSVFSGAQKAHVITADGFPDTEKIDKSLVNKIAIISVPKQRELVNLLFFWEEEITRLRLLDAEEAEIREMMRQRHGDGAPESEDLVMALKVVKEKRKILPSARKSDGTAKGDDALPSYS